MSTRCTIRVYDDSEEFFVYRHCDGYPYEKYGVPATLPEALPYAWQLPRFEASDFAAAVVRAWKDEGGGHIRLAGSHEFAMNREYQYEVTAKDGKLWIGVYEVEWCGPTTLIIEGYLENVVEFCAEWPEE